MSFAQNLKQAMIRRNLNQKELANITGLSVSSISQYLSGSTTNIKPQNLYKLAYFLGVTTEDLMNDPVKDQPISEKKITIEKAAQMIGKSEQFIRIALQRGTAPFGFAVQMPSGKWSYHISPKKLSEYMGE